MLLKSDDYYMMWSDMKDKTREILIPVKIEDETVFANLKFNYLKWVKSDPDPDNRVADFEWCNGNRLNFKRREKLLRERM